MLVFQPPTSVWGVILAAVSFLSSPVSKFTGGVRDGLYNIDFPFLGKLLILNYYFLFLLHCLREYS